MENSRKLTFINLFTGVITMGIQIIVSFFLSPYIVKTLGAEANGFVQLANNFVMYASLITVAFNSMAGRFISISYHRGEFDKAKSYYSSAVLCNMALIVLFIPMAVIIISKIDRIIDCGNTPIQDIKLIFLFVFVNYFIGLITSLLSIAFYVKNELYINNIINLFRNIMNAVSLLFIFLIFPPRVFYTSLVMVALSIVLVPIYIKYKKSLLPEISFEKKYANYSSLIIMLKSGVWNTINQCGHILMTGLDLLITDIFIDPEAMGELAVAKTIPTTIASLATVLNTNFAPELTIDWANENKKDMLVNLKKNMRISSVLVSMPVVTFSVFSISFYRLWVPSLNAERLGVLSILTMMAFIPLAGPQTLNNIFQAANRLKVNSIAFFITGILNVGIVYLLLDKTDLGVYAVAGVSSALAIVRNLTLTMIYTAYLMGQKWYIFYKDVLISLLCSFINFSVGIFIAFSLPTDSWLGLISSVVLTCVMTLTIELLFMFSKNERQLFIDKIKGRFLKNGKS
ncbi:MAG: MATE family efflux transporter [Lachnospiraceae bacterium]|nr:MATE family efflux transporter [Lachnospiraceae bacterium]